MLVFLAINTSQYPRCVRWTCQVLPKYKKQHRQTLQKERIACHKNERCTVAIKNTSCSKKHVSSDHWSMHVVNAGTKRERRKMFYLDNHIHWTSKKRDAEHWTCIFQLNADFWRKIPIVFYCSICLCWNDDNQSNATTKFRIKTIRQYQSIDISSIWCHSMHR